MKRKILMELMISYHFGSFMKYTHLGLRKYRPMANGVSDKVSKYPKIINGLEEGI